MLLCPHGGILSWHGAEARPAFCLETTDSSDVLEEAGLSVMTERQEVSN